MSGLESLPPLLKPGLEVVFVGTEPGRDSLAAGHYYASSSNSFYSDLHDVGFTDRLLWPEQYRELLAYGIGLDDVYDDAAGLRHRIEATRPHAVCFNSKQALERFAGVIDTPWRGSAASEHARFRVAILVWAVPDSSGRAAGHRASRLSLLKELRQQIASTLG